MMAAEVGDKPLIDGEIGNAVEADIAVAPGLRRRPFDRVIKIDRLRERPGLALAWHLPLPRPSMRTLAYPRHPPLRIDGLPVHQWIWLSSSVLGGTQSLSFWYGPRLSSAGCPLPVLWTTHIGLQPAPSRIGTSTSFSIKMAVLIDGIRLHIHWVDLHGHSYSVRTRDLLGVRGMT